jgi:DNA-binding MarR family transcriptional regulator
MDAPAASRLVAFLVRRRVVESRPDREDRRRTLLHLTTAGVALAERLSVSRDELRVALEDGFSPEEAAALRGGLRRVLANAQAIESALLRAPLATRRNGRADPKARATRPLRHSPGV